MSSELVFSKLVYSSDRYLSSNYHRSVRDTWIATAVERALPRYRNVYMHAHSRELDYLSQIVYISKFNSSLFILCRFCTYAPYCPHSSLLILENAVCFSLQREYSRSMSDNFHYLQTLSIFLESLRRLSFSNIEVL